MVIHVDMMADIYGYIKWLNMRITIYNHHATSVMAVLFLY